MAAKSTKLEVARRVEAVTRMLLRDWREPRSSSSNPMEAGNPKEGE